MHIIKANYSSESEALESLDAMSGIKCLRLGSAVVWLQNMHNAKQAALVVHMYDGEPLKPTDEDRRLLIGSL